MPRAVFYARQGLRIGTSRPARSRSLLAVWAYGRILAAARRAGQPMALPDAAIAAIAAIALANCCALATRNVKDFASTGLEVVNPWRTAA
jgi:hypothetical protein